MRVGYFGPEGTFTQEAMLASSGGMDLDSVPLATIHETVMAVHDGTVDRGLVPIENSLEGSVNATLDALAIETEDVAIVGELVHPILHCLIARTELRFEDVDVIVSHPQASAQCARFLRTQLPRARVVPATSTAEAVRMVAERDERWAALGNRLAAELYGAVVLRAGVEDRPGNETRFAWLARRDRLPGSAADRPTGAPRAGRGASPQAWKTAVVFWGEGTDAPGWLVRCLSELAEREVNLTRIESRPRKQGLGLYMFFVDLEGRDTDPSVEAALEGLRTHVEMLRVLGSFPAA